MKFLKSLPVMLIILWSSAAVAQGRARPFEITDNSFLVEEAFNQEAGFNCSQESRPSRFSPFSSQFWFTLLDRIDVVWDLNSAPVCGETSAKITEQGARTLAIDQR